MTRIRRVLRTLVPAAALAAAWGPPAHADIDVPVGNGDRVTGTFLPADEVETFRAVVPKGAKLSVQVKGKKARGASRAPVPALRLLDPDGLDEGGAAVVANRTGAKVTNFTVGASGEHRIVVQGDGTQGDYQLTIRWKSPTRFAVPGVLAGTPVRVPFAADRGAKASFSVRRGSGSAALPRLSEVRNAADAVIATLAQPSAGATSHSVKNVVMPEGGDLGLVVSDAGASGGTFAATIVVRPPAPSKRKLGLTSRELGADPAGASAAGALIGPDGGALAADGIASLDGASVSVPEGGLKAPTAILIGTSPDIAVKGTVGAGPTVYFGPEGLTFAKGYAATVTLPFDVGAFGGDTSALRVYTRDAKGKVTEVKGVTIDAVAGTVSFPAAHFSSFRVVRRGRPALLPGPKADLNDDGKDDLVAPAPAEIGNRGNVFVFFGGSGLHSTTTATADATIAGTLSGGDFGAAVATGDVNGDGVADLVVGAPEAGLGFVYVFFGGTTFTDNEAAEADVTLRGTVSGSRFGGSLAVGDVNGDGKDDLVVGSELTANGDAYVFFGGAGLASGDATTAAVTFTGASPGDSFGSSVAVGDVTGDGRRDVLAGATQSENGGHGKLYVFRGGPAVASASAASAAFEFTGEAADSSFGWNVQAGDVDGDGFADVVTGTPIHQDAVTGAGGALYVFRGGPDLAGRSASLADLLLRGGTSSEGFGDGLGVGDIDGDGDAELIVGSGGYDASGSNNGAVTILGLGEKLGADPTPIRRIIVHRFQSTLMDSVLRPVDVNGDARADILFGAERDDTAGNNAGAIYIVTGPSLPGIADQAPIVITGATQGVFLGR